MKFMGFVAGSLLALPAAAWCIDVRVDNESGPPAYTEAGSNWRIAEVPGQNGSGERVTDQAGATATWRPDLPFPSAYRVFAVFRSGADRAPNTSYTLTHVGGSDTVEVSQRGNGEVREVPLGVFSFAEGTSGTVRLNSPGGAPCVADAIVFRVGTPGNDPPVITSILRSPAAPTSQTELQVTARITDETSITSAMVRYQVLPGGETVEIAAMDDGTNDDGTAGNLVYGATIPTAADRKSVTFSFQATDSTGLTGRSGERTVHISRDPKREFRAIWADSWQAGFRSMSEADELVKTCRETNINMLIPEVRKVGDAYYNSDLEPRAKNIVGPPDFDPLAYLLRLAHDTSDGKNRLQVHGWFVMNRIAKTETLDPKHVLARHPEYEMLKSDGARGGESRYLDPGHPGAVDHNMAVILDCLRKYDLDGFHFDYIRYPELEGEWGYNPTSIARFNSVYGRSGKPREWDPDWKAWRRECVSLQVKKIYIHAWKLKPSALLTVSTINWGWGYDDFTSSPAWNRAFQDWSGWLRSGIVDYNSLMNYTRATDPARYQGWTARSLADDNIRGSIIGIGAYLSPTIQGSLDQLLHARSAGAAGLNIYDWGDEVKASTGGETRAQFYAELKNKVFPTWVEPPVPEWKANPKSGIIEGIITSNGEFVDHAIVRLQGRPETETVTDGSGWYGILHVPPGDYSLEIVKQGVGSASAKASAAAGKIATVNADLKEAASEKSNHPGAFHTIEKRYENSNVDGYNLYVPNSYAGASKAFPAIVFLQGGLGVGGKVDSIFNWELPKELIEATASGEELRELKLNTFIYIMPHITAGEFYENVDAIKQVIAEVCTKYNIDKSRIYLTGLSRGGHGTWGVASKLPEPFAAIAPICGNAQGISDYGNLTKVPILTAHNVADDRVNYKETEATVRKIEELSGKSFSRLQAISEVEPETKSDLIFISGEGYEKGHNAWKEVYNNVQFYKWLLRWRKG